MAELLIYKDRIRKNIHILSDYFAERNVEWSLVTKVFSGDKEFLKHVLTPDITDTINSVGDSRLTSLKNLRELNPELKTIYIKPPAAVYADDVVRYADISLNTSYSTICALNKAAKEQNKTHKIIVMIELGELREGVQRDDLLDFYNKIFQLENIEVIGIGSNLGCMYGIEPTYDKLLQLCLYKELISAKFDVEMRLISGGSSITLPMLDKGGVPKDVNHFRIGEAAFFGKSPLNDEQFLNLHTDTFEFSANIIELEKKDLVPDGILSDSNVGHTIEFDEEEHANETTFKAILDFGLLDVDREDIDPLRADVSFVGVTSDMMVVDVGANDGSNNSHVYKVGDQMKFRVNYMAVARLLNSKFIDKCYV